MASCLEAQVVVVTSFLIEGPNHQIYNTAFLPKVITNFNACEIFLLYVYSSSSDTPSILYGAFEPNVGIEFRF